MAEERRIEPSAHPRSTASPCRLIEVSRAPVFGGLGSYDLHHHSNDFLLRAGIEPARPELASDAAGLESAPGQPRIDRAPAVDPHGAGAHSRGDGVRGIDI